MTQSTTFLTFCCLIVLVLILSIIIIIMSLSGFNKVENDRDPTISENILTSISIMNGIAIALCITGIIVGIMLAMNINSQQKKRSVYKQSSESTINKVSMNIKELDKITGSKNNK